MIREDVDDALRLAAAPTFERLRRDRRRVGELFAPLFRCIEEHVFEADFGAEVAWARSGVSRRARFPLEMTLASYIEELRVDTALRMREAGAGRIPTGRAALAVGLGGYRVWRAAYRRRTGESPELVRLPERSDPGFDDPTWHHARQGTLSVDDVRFLLSRLRDLGGETAAGRTGGRETPRAWRPEERRGEISDSEAREALEHAAAEPLERLLRDAEGLPSNVVKVVEDLAESLFDPGFSGDECRRRAEVTETGISTRVRFYLGDTLAVSREKLQVEVAMRLVGDLRFKFERIAEAVGLSPRHLQRACHRRVGASASEVRKTLQRTAEEPEYRLWCRAGRGALSRADVLALEGFLRALHPQALALPASALAFRSDVDPSRVADVLDLYRSMPSHETAASRKLGEVLRTHPRFSAAHWYCHWIRDRLGHGSLDAAWEDWQTANRDLAQLLEQSREVRLELVREVRKLRTDAFLWLLVDCVEVRLFHDGVESEHYADLAVAGAEARWLVDQSSESAGLHALTLALKANALQRRNDLEGSSETFKRAFVVDAAFEIGPWISGRILSLHASHLDRLGELASMDRALARGARHFKQAGDLLERLRCLVQRCPIWFSSGRDPSRHLARCIEILQVNFPFAAQILEPAHCNRLLSCIYLRDQLTGSHLSSITRFRSEMPPPSSAYMATNYRQVDGLIAALEGRRERAELRLREAASWYEDHKLLNDAAVAWMQYAWAVRWPPPVPSGRV